MPASLTLYDLSDLGNGGAGDISLGEVLIREGLGEGEPVRVMAVNDGTVALREISVHVSDEGADFAQLAVDNDGEPGVWAAPGESISLSEGTLFPGEELTFWSRAIYDAEHLEGLKEFSFVTEATSIG